MAARGPPLGAAATGIHRGGAVPGRAAWHLLGGRALGELLPGRAAAIRFTVFGFPPLRERMRDTVLPALQPLPAMVTIEEDPARERARGYYERGAIRVDVAGDAGWRKVGDGGFTSWTAQLLGDAKERCFISCAATQRLAALG